MIPERDIQILLDSYCAIITHALRCIEKAVVPIRQVRLGCNFSNWTRTFNRVMACIHVKSPMQIDCERPHKGIVNAIKLESNWKFVEYL